MSSQLRTRSEPDVLAAIGRREVATDGARTGRTGVSVGVTRGLPERGVRIIYRQANDNRIGGLTAGGPAAGIASAGKQPRERSP